MPQVDISIPIPSPRGIITCTLKDAQTMSVRDMEHEIAAPGPQLHRWRRPCLRLSDRAARDELSVADLSHSTFGIVDSGIAGSMLGTGIMCVSQLSSAFFQFQLT